MSMSTLQCIANLIDCPVVSVDAHAAGIAEALNFAALAGRHRSEPLQAERTIEEISATNFDIGCCCFSRVKDQFDEYDK